MMAPSLRRWAAVLAPFALFAAYLPLFVALPGILPVVGRHLLGGERLFVLALYTVLAYGLPVALAVVWGLERRAGGKRSRLRLALTFGCALNWLPLCMAVTAWVLLADPGAWVR